MSNQQQFDNIIKSALMDKAEKVSPPENMFENIKSEIQLNRNEKVFNLKERLAYFNLKKSVITAACCMFIVAGAIFTFSPDARVSALRSIGKHVNGYIDMKSYDKAPSKDVLKKDLGYDAKMPAFLPGGYKLIDASVMGHIDGSTPDKQYDKKEAGGIYSKDNTKEESISLSVWKAGARKDSPICKNAKTVTVGNTTARWAEYTVHVLPSDVKLTKEQEAKERKACENGKEVLIGASSKNGTKIKEEFNTAHSLQWTQNNVNYELTDQNNKLSFEEMSKIAENIINSK
ncbi:hypothetical protein Ccar_12975 [Clostridium carboxidivorans P7]|uniref:DUF4367 domain-containing protein n=1 Tax=Clostridium carboxidivorans P7 TaxID=536227 RepID=C6PRA5_9CLOT|nr:hypothetical protein [Clostridium carboxidivorans]AKN31724.1 hypothetical protein Ccar_12975 [Clostridium carboxidivorans P7]EET88205.1 hypothetical protein CcarbDRAFT_1322 [Clostridium carboxidivorans P7]EFG87452.1 hypothetical protein CLCAR_2985 [Clostridium carboxidivorans P7]